MHKVIHLSIFQYQDLFEKAFEKQSGISQCFHKIYNIILQIDSILFQSTSFGKGHSHCNIQVNVMSRS